ncbi:MAG TPA: RluA family pseudouridine synthase [bacterium]|nr:RluA family pseudouridine synthase [bacterium]
MKIEVIFEDNHLLAVVKPAGIPVQKDIGGKEDLQTILKNYLKEKYNKPGEVYLGIVHRLDQPVGGVMVFAKTSKAASRLSDQIRKNEWRKEYLAIVKGGPDSRKGYFEDYLLKDSEKNTVTVVSKETKGAKLAKLSYEIIEKTEKRTLLKILLETGRSHQIRVQLASRGFPIINDQKYSNSRYAKTRGNIALWAASLTIIHPVKGEEITFFKELPEEFRNL